MTNHPFLGHPSDRNLVQILLIALAMTVTSCGGSTFSSGNKPAPSQPAPAAKRDDGKGGKERHLRNSAFNEDKDAEADGEGADEESEEDGPAKKLLTSVDAPVKGFCSDNGTQSNGGNVITTTSVKINFVDDAGKVLLTSGQLKDEEGLALSGSDIKAGLVNNKRLSLSLPQGSLPENKRVGINLCGDQHPDNCGDTLAGMDVLSADINKKEHLKAGAQRSLGFVILQTDSEGNIVGSRKEIALLDRNSSGTAWALYPGEDDDNRKLLTGAGGGGQPNCDVTNSPLVIDLNNTGVTMVAPLSGPYFDIVGAGKKNLVSWPEKATSVMVALDRNGNGSIDDVNELFGNNTVGPDGNKAANGFAALAKYDGNRDGKINADDAIYAELLAWSDANNDASVDSGELSTIAELGIASIDLSYQDMNEVDQYSNETKQRSIVELVDGSVRMIFDIWFRTLPVTR